MTEFCGVLHNVFKLFVTEISENIISSIARGVEKPIFKEPIYENNMAKKYVVEPSMVENDVPNRAREVERINLRESNHGNNMSTKDFHKSLMAKIEQPIRPKNDETHMKGFHKPLVAKIEKQLHLSINDVSYLAIEHVLNPNMAKNDEQYNVHESEFFEIVQNVKLFEFLRPFCTMVLAVQNLLRICGSHQNIILMMWLIKLTNCSYEFEALRTWDDHLKCMNLARKACAFK